MGRTNVTYGGYLQVENLLDLQRPVGDDTDQGGELFFIIAHQTSELWLKSLLVDLEGLDEAVTRREPLLGAPMIHARRALAGARMLVAGIESLRALDTEAFLGFRDHLGSASGAQSSQFARVRALVGIGKPNGGPIEASLRTFAQHHQVALDAVAAGNAVHDAWYWLVDTLLEFSSALWRWGVYHVDVTQRLIGALPGTGGTSGVQFLTDRLLERPFPTLWRGRVETLRRQLGAEPLTRQSRGTP